MGKRGPKPGERVPYGFTDWNSPLAQREIWGAPKLYEWQEQILSYFVKNLHVHAVMSTPNESGKTQVVVPLLGLGCMAAFPGATVYSTAGAEAQINGNLCVALRKDLGCEFMPNRDAFLSLLHWRGAGGESEAKYGKFVKYG